MRKLLVVAALAALLIPAEASASLLLGVEGSKSRFRGQTNQATDVNLDFIGWGVHKQSLHGQHAGRRQADPGTLVRHREQVRERGDHPSRNREGKGDRVLIDVAQALDRFGSFAYVRPYAEMNG